MKVNKEQKEFQVGIYSNKVISDMFFGVINLAVRLGMYSRFLLIFSGINLMTCFKY